MAAGSAAPVQAMDLRSKDRNWRVATDGRFLVAVSTLPVMWEDERVRRIILLRISLECKDFKTARTRTVQGQPSAICVDTRQNTRYDSENGNVCTITLDGNIR